MIIKYSREMAHKIKNISSLPGGLNCKYLLVLVAHNGDYVAHSWKRKAPKEIPAGFALITF